MRKEEEAEVLSIEGREIRVTHPHKLYFSKQLKLSKLDLVHYYLSVAPGALGGIRDRPIVLKRFVNGAEGEAFYQKRAPADRPTWLRTVTLSFPSGRTAEELVVDDAAGLAWIVNLGCIELHPHPVRSRNLDHPDELRIDLDPGPGVGWGDVRHVALEVKSLLEEVGLRGWPKTSGSRGMHVNVRIEPRWTFGEVRQAALALSRAVERRAPALASSKWWKEERHGVFLDYNQNAKDRTTCSSYSVRPVPNARVSAPLYWREIPDCEPDDFTVLTMPNRFAEIGDPDEGVDASPGSLEKLGNYILGKSRLMPDDGGSGLVAERVTALHHLARAVAGSRYSPGDLFAMFTCYFDEAGGEDHGFTVVAGFMASVEQWDSFEIDWKLFLIKYGVPYMHMLEFAHGNGPFKKWKDPRFEITRRNFLCDAAEIIHSRVKRGFLCIVKHVDFYEASALYPSLIYPNSPYALAGRSCAAFAKTWARKHLSKLDIEFVFEDGGPDKHGLSDTLTKLNPRLPDPIFKPSRDMPEGRRGLVQLQAADWLAYEIRKWQVDRPDLQIPRKDARKSLRALLNLPELDMRTYGEKSCAQLAIKLQKMESEIMALKPSSEYDTFNSAMDTILKADPAKVKAQMEADKREREEKRRAKRDEEIPKK